MQDFELLQLAAQARAASYSPYSGYKVGAALLCKDGSMYTGCNVENISYGGTICAERTAAVKAVSDGKTKFIKIAVSASGDEYAIPCGLCLQFLSEFVEHDFEVICANRNDEFKKYVFSELLPAIFKSASVNHV